VLTLLKTFVDIIALRKGPDSVPSSWIVMHITLLLMVTSAWVVTIAIDTEEPIDYVQTFLGYALGICFYAAIIYLRGQSARMLPAISSIIGCGSIISFLFAAEVVIFRPLVGADEALVIAYMILLWSVPVEGHIMARTINSTWLAGINIAILALVMQVGLQSALSSSN
jgi:hypothetical protein